MNRWIKRVAAVQQGATYAALAVVLAACASADTRVGPGPTAAAVPEANGARRPSQVWGYIPNFDRVEAWASAEAHSAALSGVSLFQYHLDRDGDVLAYPGPPDSAEPRVPGLVVVPVIANSLDGAWNRDVVAQVLHDPARRRHHVQQVLALAVDGDYPAVEIDYESLSAAEREPVAVFVEELAAALHARNKQLAVAVHAKLAEPGDWGGPQAQDWARIGAAADRVVVLTYDYDPARPSPIAPLEWTRTVLRLAVSLIPPAKVIQGIPLYGYDWAGSTPGVGRTYRELVEVARVHNAQPRRDARDKQLGFDYTTDTTAHQVSFIDAEGVQALVAVGREVGVGGYALWRLGGEDPAIWSASVLASP
jgi:spore germination protein